VDDINSERAYPAKLSVGYVIGTALLVMNPERKKLLRVNKSFNWFGAHLVSPLPGLRNFSGFSRNSMRISVASELGVFLRVSQFETV
jgi:hypothetical protein